MSVYFVIKSHAIQLVFNIFLQSSVFFCSTVYYVLRAQVLKAIPIII